MSTVLSPPEARVILHNISWSLYEQLLAAHEEKSSPHFVYDRGELEITVPSSEHEELNRLIDNCIAVIAMEWNIEYCNAGSTTFKREDLERGFELDSCFYAGSSMAYAWQYSKVVYYKVNLALDDLLEG